MGEGNKDPNSGSVILQTKFISGEKPPSSGNLIINPENPDTLKVDENPRWSDLINPEEPGSSPTKGHVQVLLDIVDGKPIVPKVSNAVLQTTNEQNHELVEKEITEWNGSVETLSSLTPEERNIHVLKYIGDFLLNTSLGHPQAEKFGENLNTAYLKEIKKSSTPPSSS